MGKNMGKAIIRILVIILLIVVNFKEFATAADIQSQINGKILDSNNVPEKYSFLVCGHIYGDPNPSVYPSASFHANMNMMNNTDAKFFVSLGDMLRISNEEHADNFKKSIATLRMPLFNAVGNHDVSNREFYENNFGRTYYDFTYGSEKYIFLDTELSAKGEIIGDQMEYFMRACEEALKNPDISNVFIFSHKLIWSVKSDYQIVYKHSNAPYYFDTTSFIDNIEPILNQLAKKKAVYWISGDIGVQWSLPIFFQKERGTNITFAAVGIGDTEKDAVLKIDVNNGEIDIIPISLTHSEVYSIEYYGTKYWENYFQNISTENISIESRLIRVIRNKYFWAGAIGAFLCSSVVFIGVYFIRLRNL